jgi:hypothetical protein
VAVLLGISALFATGAVLIVAFDDPLIAAVTLGVAVAVLTAFGTQLATVSEEAGGSVIPFRPNRRQEKADARAL